MATNIDFDATFWAQPDSTTAYTGYELSTDSSGRKICTLTETAKVTGGSIPSGKTLKIPNGVK